MRKKENEKKISGKKQIEKRSEEKKGSLNLMSFVFVIRAYHYHTKNVLVDGFN